MPASRSSALSRSAVTPLIPVTIQPGPLSALLILIAASGLREYSLAAALPTHPQGELV